MGDEKGRLKKGQKTHSPQEPKKKKELVPLVVASYLTHGPSNVACMQIVRSNSNRRLRASINPQRNLPIYSKG